MDQTFINFALAAASSVLGWWAREMWTSVKELKNDLAKLREELPRDYCIKIDLDKRFDRMEQTLDRIWARLDGKVDKHG
jgi:hypothetical protein